MLLVTVGVACACSSSDAGRTPAAEASDSSNVVDASVSDSGKALDVRDDGGSANADAGSACDAGLMPCGDSCVDVTHDAHNCGRCSRDCLGSTCSGGACSPVSLGTGQHHGGELVVDATDVYWRDFNYGCDLGGAILHVPKSGGTATVFAAPSNANRLIGLDGIAIDANNVYWGYEWNAVQSGKKGGTLALGPSAGAIAIDATRVHHFAPGSNGWLDLVSTPIDGGTPAVLFAGAASVTGGIAVDASYVYWTAPYELTVRKVPKSGGPAVTLDSGAYPAGIATDGQYVYWTDATNGTVSRVPTSGGNSQKLSSAEAHPGAIAVDASGVFWIDAGSQQKDYSFDGAAVMELPASQSVPVILATLHDQAPGGLAVDATAVYWTTPASAVMRVAKY